MAATKAVWGIDLGQCALKAIRVRVAGDKVEAIDHVYLEHAKILSQPDADRQALINEAMKKFIAGHDLSKETLVVSVPGQNTLARFTKLPPVNKKKIPEIVKYEAQQQIPFDMEEVIWDYQTFEDPQAAETQVGIFAMRRELLRSHLAFLSNLNLEPAMVQAAPLALYNALKFDGIIGKEAIAILDIGAQNTDLIVVDGDSLWTRNIPLGGNNFTDALSKTFKLSFNKAERLKRDAQKHKYARQIFQAMRPVFADLVAEIQRSIGFFTSSRRGVKLNKVLAMGNAFQLPGMTKFVQQNLGMEVVRPTAFNKLSLADNMNTPEMSEQLLSFGVAYGLALQGLGKAPITSNLLPTEIAKQVVWRRKTPWFYGAAACLLVAGGLVWLRDLQDRGLVEKARGEVSRPSFPIKYEDRDKDQKNPFPDPRAVEIIERGSTASTGLGKAGEITAAAQHLEQVNSQLETQYNDTVRQLEELAKLQADKVVWPEILHLIHDALPQGKLDPELAKVDDPVKFQEMIKQHPEKYERGKRQQIFIEKIDAQYSADVGALFQQLKQTDAAARAVAQPAAPGGTPRKGFLIRLRARTPYQGKNPGEGGIFFVNNTFLANLRKAYQPANAKGAQPIYFDGVGQPLWQRQTKQWKPGAEAGSSGGGPSYVGVVSDSEKDPVTGEAVNDNLFEIVFMAVLGEKPAEPGAAANPS